MVNSLHSSIAASCLLVCLLGVSGPPSTEAWTVGKRAASGATGLPSLGQLSIHHYCLHAAYYCSQNKRSTCWIIQKYTQSRWRPCVRHKATVCASPAAGRAGGWAGGRDVVLDVVLDVADKPSDREVGGAFHTTGPLILSDVTLSTIVKLLARRGGTHHEGILRCKCLRISKLVINQINQ